MSASHSSVIGDTVKFEIEVYVDDVLTAPTTVTFLVEEPDGTDQDITESTPSTGVYVGTFKSTKAGWHRVSFTGAGNDGDFVRERTFYVATSSIVVDVGG
jgi:flagellar hook assembly protein FlgD